jgi:hypothetical protein
MCPGEQNHSPTPTVIGLNPTFRGNIKLLLSVIISFKIFVVLLLFSLSRRNTKDILKSTVGQKRKVWFINNKKQRISISRETRSPKSLEL